MPRDMSDELSVLLEEVRAPNLLSRPIGEIERLAIKWRRWRGHHAEASKRGRPLKVAVLGSFLTDYLADMLVVMLARRGFDAVVAKADYGQMVHEVLTHGPTLAGQPDLVFFLPTIVMFEWLRH